MKITCIIHSLDGGGAERVMAALASLLSQRSHQVTLVTLGDGGGDRHDVHPDVTRCRLNLLFDSGGLVSKVIGNRRRIVKLRRTLVDLASDVVLSFCDRTNILAAFACPANIPLVLSERSDPAEQHLGPLWELLRNRAYPRASHLVALSETSAGHLRRRYNVPLTVIPSAVDVPPIRSDRGMAAANRLVMGIGRLEAEKGFDRLIHAFADSVGNQSDWRLRILGEGSCRSALEQLAEQRGVGDRVELPGWVRPVWNDLAAATMFVLPSRYEGFPSALLEAMVVGVPSIAVDCESGPRAVLAGRQPTVGVPNVPRSEVMPTSLGPRDTDELPGGLLVPNDSESLADAIRLFVADPQTRERIGSKGIKAGECFSWEAMVERYESVLQSVAGMESDPDPPNEF
ncbi:MAG: glycosyltransferase [Rubripirellula sp.]|nr:glycosyltransferase [Rubripirellula sp.]